MPDSAVVEELGSTCSLSQESLLTVYFLILPGVIFSMWSEQNISRYG